MNKIFVLLFVTLCLSGCSNSNVKPDFTRKILSRELAIPEKQIEIKSVSQLPGTILTDASVQLAFVLQKQQDGQYHILKISRSTGKWEAPDQFFLPRSSLGRSMQSALVAELCK